MEVFGCFHILKKKKKREKGVEGSSKKPDEDKGLNILSVKFHPAQSLESNKVQDKAIENLPVKVEHTDDLDSSCLRVSVPCGVQKVSMCKVKVTSHGSPDVGEASEVAYEGEDEHEDYSSMKRDFSDFDLQARDVDPAEEEFHFEERKTGYPYPLHAEDEYAKESASMKQGGHVSDPGIGKSEIWASPLHKRSCSNLESRKASREVINKLSLSESKSFEQMQELQPESPLSMASYRSADRVMLKKHSSTQLLPSRSRRLWWKLFLWSHRNSHKSWITKPQPLSVIKVAFSLNQQGGYSSDTLEPNRQMDLDKKKLPESFSGEPMKNAVNVFENYNKSWDGFQAASGLWPQNQWVAFSAESSSYSYSRVDDWVKDLESEPHLVFSDDDITNEPYPENGTSPARSTTQSIRSPDINLSEEITHANNIIRSLNSSSTVAHICGTGLKVLPTISRFHSLRSVNLSSNLIVHITPGSLPKGLHSLDLSRNKIQNIEGLRELDRLRVLDLSYNRISRIGQGLSNCTLIKELYLSGNKISDVEGLHRLLKLTVLDLSFNKITTTKALGQLVANYNSMLALNLLGNPIQNNIADEQLRKTVCSLLSKLVYLNKQPVKPQRAREALKDSVAKAALGNTSRSSSRKPVKRASHGGSVPSGRRSNASVAQKSRSRSKTRFTALP